MIRRRSDLDAIRKWTWPILAAILALFLAWRDSQAEIVRGVDSKRAFYIQTRFETGPLKEFVVRLDLPDIPSKDWR